MLPAPSSPRAAPALVQLGKPPASLDPGQPGTAKAQPHTGTSQTSHTERSVPLHPGTGALRCLPGPVAALATERRPGEKEQLQPRDPARAGEAPQAPAGCRRPGHTAYLLENSGPAVASISCCPAIAGALLLPGLARPKPGTAPLPPTGTTRHQLLGPPCTRRPCLAATQPQQTHAARTRRSSSRTPGHPSHGPDPCHMQGKATGPATRLPALRKPVQPFSTPRPALPCADAAPWLRLGPRGLRRARLGPAPGAPPCQAGQRGVPCSGNRGLRGPSPTRLAARAARPGVQGRAQGLLSQRPSQPRPCPPARRSCPRSPASAPTGCSRSRCGPPPPPPGPRVPGATAGSHRRLPEETRNTGSLRPPCCPAPAPARARARGGTAGPGRAPRRGPGCGGDPGRARPGPRHRPAPPCSRALGRAGTRRRRRPGAQGTGRCGGGSRPAQPRPSRGRHVRPRRAPHANEARPGPARCGAAGPAGIGARRGAAGRGRGGRRTIPHSRGRHGNRLHGARRPRPPPARPGQPGETPRGGAGRGALTRGAAAGAGRGGCPCGRRCRCGCPCGRGAAVPARPLELLRPHDPAHPGARGARSAGTRGGGAARSLTPSAPAPLRPPPPPARPAAPLLPGAARTAPRSSPEQHRAGTRGGASAAAATRGARPGRDTAALALAPAFSPRRPAHPGAVLCRSGGPEQGARCAGGSDEGGPGSGHDGCKVSSVFVETSAVQAPSGINKVQNFTMSWSSLYQKY